MLIISDLKSPPSMNGDLPPVDMDSIDELQKLEAQAMKKPWAKPDNRSYENSGNQASFDSRPDSHENKALSDFDCQNEPEPFPLAHNFRITVKPTNDTEPVVLKR